MAWFSEIQRVNTILYCRRWAETVAFYRDRLSLEISFESDWFVEFRVSPTAFLSIADQSRASISSAGGKGITLSLQIGRLPDLHHHLTDIGVAPTAIRSGVMGADVFYLFDPEGNRIEFWCPDR
jgi:catechol 2,3-dioxygenase-like lactoylglutathione lyase family enzyme